MSASVACSSDSEEDVRSVDESDAGSLVDFVVDDEDEEEDDDDDASSVESEPPATKEEAIARDLDGISDSNIVHGKRKRVSTQFYDRQVFASPEYRRMMLEDVGDEVEAAVEESDDEDEGEDEDDASFAPSEDDDDADDAEDDDDDDDADGADDASSGTAS